MKPTRFPQRGGTWLIGWGRKEKRQMIHQERRLRKREARQEIEDS